MTIDNGGRWRRNLRARWSKDQGTTAEPPLPRALVSAAAQQIGLSSIYRPPKFAETVALLALWPKESQRQALVATLRWATIDADDIPLRSHTKSHQHYSPASDSASSR